MTVLLEGYVPHSLLDSIDTTTSLMSLALLLNATTNNSAVYDLLDGLIAAHDLSGPTGRLSTTTQFTPDGIMILT